MAILDPSKPYTFRNYFELRIDALELAQYFGYGFTRKQLTLKSYPGELDRLGNLQADILEILSRLVRSNEQAKREALIFPVVRIVAHYADTFLRIEYPLKVSEQLQGTVDHRRFMALWTVITSATLENAKMNRLRVGWAKRSVPITQLQARWARFALPILRIKSLYTMHPI